MREHVRNFNQSQLHGHVFMNQSSLYAYYQEE